MTTLTELVDKYKEKRSSYEEWKLSDFKARKLPIEKLIEYAVWGTLPDLKQDSHQHDIDRRVLTKMFERLSTPIAIEKIENCTNFNEILTIVYELRISGFGQLCVYDTSLRLGAMFGKYPEVIFLHSGALKGIKKLKGHTWVTNHSQKFKVNANKHPYIAKDCLPAELQRLEPYHIENFLCIYKKKLSKVTTN